MDFVKKHEKELSNLQRKYLNVQKMGNKLAKRESEIKGNLRQEYKERKMMEFEIDLMNTKIDIRSEIIEEIYDIGDFKLVEKYLAEINERLKNKILYTEYKSGNEEIVYRNFDKLSEGELKSEIIEKQLRNKNLEFLLKNYEYIKNLNIKEKIQMLAFKNEKVEFISKYFDDFPKNIQMESAIRFKNLDISEEKMRELLRK